MNRDELTSLIAAGGQGSNPFVERQTQLALQDQRAKQDMALQKLLKGETVPQKTEQVRNSVPDAPLPADISGPRTTPDQLYDTKVTPAHYEPGLEAQSADYGQKRNAENAQELFDKNQGRGGGSVGVSDKGVTIAAKEFNPFQHGPQQAKSFDGEVVKAYKPIHEQLNASKATLDALDQGNATSDKLALINEARLAAGAGGSRAISHMVDILSGGATANSDFQGKLNWLQNTPNIPTMQPAMRDAIRESVFNRLPQLDQMHQQAQSSLSQRGAVVAPYTDYGSLIKAQSGVAGSNLDQLKNMQNAYQKQRQGASNPISSPSTANANPTTLDKLKSFFTGGNADQSPAGSPPAMSFEEFKAAKKAGKI